MALVLEQALYNGDIVRYHRIAEYQVDLNRHVAHCILHSFRTQEERALHVAPVVQRTFPFTRGDNLENLPAEAYATIKALPEWVSAVDI